MDRARKHVANVRTWRVARRPILRDLRANALQRRWTVHDVIQLHGIVFGRCVIKQVRYRDAPVVVDGDVAFETGIFVVGVDVGASRTAHSGHVVVQEVHVDLLGCRHLVSYLHF